MLRLRLVAPLAVAALALLFWAGRTVAPGPGRAGERNAGQSQTMRLRDLKSVQPDDRLRPDVRPVGLLRDGLSIGAKERPQRFRRKFRELPSKRDPELEADAQFQKLIEMDTARRMALVDRQKHDGDPESLKQLLAGIKEPAAKIDRSILERALLDPSSEVRLAALAEISLEMDEPPIDLLAPVVEGDPDPEVRLEALEMVGERHSEPAAAVIRTALNDPDIAIRVAAEDLLEERADEASN